jgi:hypothetical protein
MTRCINHFTQKRETANGAEKSENRPASTRCHQPKDKFVRKKEKTTNKQARKLLDIFTAISIQTINKARFHGLQMKKMKLPLCSNTMP